MLHDWQRVVHIQHIFWVANHSVYAHLLMQFLDERVFFSQKLYELIVAKFLYHPEKQYQLVA